MTLPNTSAADEYAAPQQTQASAVSRAAIKAGATGAALPLILFDIGNKFRPVLGLSMGIQMRPTFGTPRNAA